MRVAAIVLAAGFGRRMHCRTPKPLLLLNGKPLLTYALRAFSLHPLIDDIIVVVNDRNALAVKKLIARYRIGKVSGIVAGGRFRKDSVRNGLAGVGPSTRLVVIHDGARPFLTSGLISSVLKEAQKHNAAICGVPVKATIKEVRGPESVVRSKKTTSGRKILVRKTLDRSTLWEIQTPQAFRKELLVKAYGKYGSVEATDDSTLVEKLGTAVRVVMGSYTNIKITTPEDLRIAQALIKK